MFYVVKEDNIFEYGDYINKAWEYPEEAKELSGIDSSYYETNKDRFAIVEGILTDISETDEFKLQVVEKEKTQRREQILEELAALDMKCIRAIREGGSDENGISFLEIYQNRINELRNEYNSL